MSAEAATLARVRELINARIEIDDCLESADNQPARDPIVAAIAQVLNTVPTVAAAPQSYSHDAVSAALNSAADTILELIGPGEDTLRDTVNLLVNVSLHFLAHPTATIPDAIAENYSEPTDEVLSWIQ